MYFFDLKSEFVSLTENEYSGQWCNIGLDELTLSEAKVIREFHRQASGDQSVDLDESNVLLVQAKNGFLENIYAASLRQGEDGGLVVKLGDTFYPAAMESVEVPVGKRTTKQFVFSCGNFAGSLFFADKESEADGIEVDGIKKKVKYTRCWIDFQDESKSEYRVPLTLDLTQEPSKQSVLSSLEDGSLAKWLKAASGSNGGGGNGTDRPMADLGEGSFSVGGFRSVGTPNGTSWLIFVNGFGDVWARGIAERQLKNPEQYTKLSNALSNGAVVNLSVGNIKKTADNKTYLDCALRIPKTVAVATPTPPAPVSGAATAPEKEPVNYDDIPF